MSVVLITQCVIKRKEMAYIFSRQLKKGFFKNYNKELDDLSKNHKNIEKKQAETFKSAKATIEQSNQDIQDR